MMQFEEIREVIGRYKTLVGMQQDLMVSALEDQEQIELAKTHLAEYTEKKDDEILKHNNELANLQMRFDRARSDVIRRVRRSSPYICSFPAPEQGKEVPFDLLHSGGMGDQHNSGTLLPTLLSDASFLE